MFEDLWDAAAARAERESALDLVSSPPTAAGWIEECRKYAIWYANHHGEVTSDDVVMRYPRPQDVNPNATGAIFRTKSLKIVGYRSSKRVSSHARRIAIFVPADAS